MPFPRDVMEIHAERLRRRAQREGVAYGPELAVQSVYELAEPLTQLLSDKWATSPGSS